MVAVVATMSWALEDPTFRTSAAGLTVEGARFTDESEIRHRTGLVGSADPSVFALATRRMAANIEELPTVLHVEVRATLPDQVVVRVVEPEPIVGWRAASGVWLMDVEGTLLARLDDAAAAALGEGWTGTALPVVEDSRATMVLAVGVRIDPMDLAAVRLLGAITPEMIGSAAPGLSLTVDDDLGYVLAWPGRWRAVFGHYRPTLLSPDRIPEQVRCLAALIGERERTVDGVTLAVSGDRCGTFVPGTPDPRPRATRSPRPRDDAEPTRRPRATRRS